MSVLDTIKANPMGITRGAFGLAAAFVTFWFLLMGKPDDAANVINTINMYVVPVTTATTIVFGFLSAMHFSRGPVPIVAAPVVVETVGQAKSDGIMPLVPPTKGIKP